MAVANVTGGNAETITLKDLACCPTLTTGLQQQLIHLSVVNMFLSMTAFLGNSLILVALHKESSLHPPSKLLFRCLATTDLCVGLASQPLHTTYWMSLVHKDWNLCRYIFDTTFVTGYALASVSLLTSTAINVDRLLALSLGLRYRQVVTLKRTYVVIATFWVVSSVAAAMYLLENRITTWYGYINVPLCVTISVASYTKIFRALRRHHNQVQVLVQQRPSQPIPLNMARYKKAVISALLVQLALVVCYLPYSVVIILIRNSRPSASYFLSWAITSVLVYFNSSLNPFLYCWKISEVRQAVKQTIRQALCCPWT